MNNKLKFTLITTCILFLSLACWTFVQAAPDIGSGAARAGTVAGYDTENITDTTISETVGKFIKGLMSMTGLIFLVLTVYAGILWMTAGGTEEKVEKALKIFRTSIIGLAIVVLAFSITGFITSRILQASDPTVSSSDGVKQGFSEGFDKQLFEDWFKD